MSCKKYLKCGCNFNVKTVGKCDVTKLNINGKNKSELNWTEISVPEILRIPELKPDIEEIDQVYANIILDNIKLIETPFAYKKYTLFSFYEAANGLSGNLPGLITALTTAVGAITDGLSNTLVGALNAALGALNLIPIKPPGFNDLIEAIQNVLTGINNLVSSINNALNAVAVAADNLLATILSVDFSAEAICQAVKTLKDALDALVAVINSIVDVIEALLDTVEAIANTIPVVGTIISTLLDSVNDFLTNTLSGLIDTLTSAVTDVLGVLLPIDCENSSVFEIISNAEGTSLSGRKLIVEGILKQKVVYTAEVGVQSVHSAHYEIPFITFLIVYPKFDGLEYQEGLEVYDPETGESKTINGYTFDETQDITVDLNEEFNVETCIEDIFIYSLDPRTIFKNATIFLKAKPNVICN